MVYSCRKKIIMKKDAIITKALLVVLCILIIIKFDKTDQRIAELSKEVASEGRLLDQLNQSQKIIIDAFISNKKDDLMDYTWIEKADGVIAHALGGLDGHRYTNSREAFEQSYASGCRVFEVDVHLTEEGCLVLFHDKNRYMEMVNVDIVDGEALAINYDSFMRTLLYRQYHTLDIQELLKIMESHEDMYVIIDWGGANNSSALYWYSGIVYFGEKYERVLDRIIPEIVSQEMLLSIRKVFPWKSYVLAYYKNRWDSVDEAIQFCKDSNIKVVDLPKENCEKENISQWSDAGIHVFAYTVNDIEEKEDLEEMGITCIYTDDLI